MDKSFPQQANEKGALAAANIFDTSLSNGAKHASFYSHPSSSSPDTNSSSPESTPDSAASSSSVSVSYAERQSQSAVTESQVAVPKIAGSRVVRCRGDKSNPAIFSCLRIKNAAVEQSCHENEPLERKPSHCSLQHAVATPVGQLSAQSRSLYCDAGVARRSTKVVNILRISVLMVLLLAAALVSVGVSRYTKNEEKNRFESEYHNHAHRIVDSFHDAVEGRLTAINSMANSITSFALSSNQSFPFVTLPDFGIRGSDVRVLADASVIHYMPLVTDENREEWERFALENRFHIDRAFEVDEKMRRQQDLEMGFASTQTTTMQPQKPDVQASNASGLNTTTASNYSLLPDGSGFHTKIWSGGIPPLADAASGTGPYLPVWQRSPIPAGAQGLINLNFDRTFALEGILPRMLATKQAFMNRATVPLNASTARAVLNLTLFASQYRFDVPEFLDDPFTFIAYPVFDSFDLKDRQVAGVLATNIYWKLFFERVLPPSAEGIFCILENSFNQTLSYRIDGGNAFFLGSEDLHDPDYDCLEESASINSYLQRQFSPASWAFNTVPLNEDYGKYTLRVYPSYETEQNYMTNDPVVYTCVVVAVFLFTSIVFISFALAVELRQQAVMENAMKHARKAANTEREMNEFLSHEVRNPLSAAISACSFLSSAVEGPSDTATTTLEKFKGSLKEDVKVIQACLLFVNDFLRSMLDLHRVAIDKLEFTLSSVCVLKEIIEPVCQMLYQRNLSFSIVGDCPEDLVVTTDRLRVKQVLLNLAFNASKFVKEGFIRIRAVVVDGFVELHVEDSGPGIPPNKRSRLFESYEDRLNELTQGTGVGLQLSKSIITSLKGALFLDDSFDCGIPGHPGSRFVVQLKKPPIPLRELSCKIPSKSTTVEDVKEDVTSAKSGGTPITHATVAENPRPKLPNDVSVLFVDDDAILRKLFVRSVKRVAPSWKIQEASHGEIALQFASEDPFQFHVIFMDQYMISTQKTLLGTETVQALRAKGVVCRICGVSANVLQDEFFAAGADCFMLKPIPCGQVELEEWLQSVLG